LNIDRRRDGTAARPAPIAARGRTSRRSSTATFSSRRSRSTVRRSPRMPLHFVLKHTNGTAQHLGRGRRNLSAARPSSAEATRPIRSMSEPRFESTSVLAGFGRRRKNFNIYAIDPTRAAEPRPEPLRTTRALKISRGAALNLSCGREPSPTFCTRSERPRVAVARFDE